MHQRLHNTTANVIMNDIPFPFIQIKCVKDHLWHISKLTVGHQSRTFEI